MQRTFLLINVVIALFICSSMSMAGETSSDAVGRHGFSLSVNPDIYHFFYEETVDGKVLDRDYGIISGLYVEARFDSSKIFAKGSINLTGSSNATYDGQTQGGQPLTMSTSEWFYQGEAAFGIKVLNGESGTLSPYGALGFRIWNRGEDNPPDYLETYTWGYAALGVNYTWKFDRGTMGLDAAIQYPISPQMQTDTAGSTDTATFHLKAKPGYHVELPFS